jgi:hypothetical protein
MLLGAIECRDDAAADRSISSAVVDQFEIETRIATCPCHFVPPTQHVP